MVNPFVMTKANIPYSISHRNTKSYFLFCNPSRNDAFILVLIYCHTHFIVNGATVMNQRKYYFFFCLLIWINYVLMYGNFLHVLIMMMMNVRQMSRNACNNILRILCSQTIERYRLWMKFYTLNVYLQLTTHIVTIVVQCSGTFMFSLIPL